MNSKIAAWPEQIISKAFKVYILLFYVASKNTPKTLNVLDFSEIPQI